MAAKSGNTFCHKLLSRVSGVESHTIQVLVNNGYGAVYPVLAMDLDRDLEKLDITLGQKSLIRNAISDAQQVFNKNKNQWNKDNEKLLQETRQLLEESLRNDNQTMDEDTGDIAEDDGDSIVTDKSSSRALTTPSEQSEHSSEGKKTKEKILSKCQKRTKKDKSRRSPPTVVTSDGPSFKGDYHSSEDNPFNDDSASQVSNENKRTKRDHSSDGDNDRQTNARINLRDRSKIKKKAFFEEIPESLKKLSNARSDTYDQFFESLEYRPGLSLRQTQPNIYLSPIKESSRRSASTPELPSLCTQIKIIKDLANDMVEDTDRPDYECPDNEGPTQSHEESNSSQNQKELTFQSTCCQICGDRAKGKNYGVRSCGGCAHFFYRVSKGLLHAEECVEKTGRCQMDPINRSLCRFCRYQACITTGMDWKGHHK